MDNEQNLGIYDVVNALKEEIKKLEEHGKDNHLFKIDKATVSRITILRNTSVSVFATLKNPPPVRPHHSFCSNMEVRIDTLNATLILRRQFIFRRFDALGIC